MSQAGMLAWTFGDCREGLTKEGGEYGDEIRLDR